MDKQGPKPSEILFPGRVTQVIDPHYFWMQMGSAERLACFLKIQQDMQLYCESHWSSVADADNIVIGQLVLVDTGQSDIRWRRGQVSRISSDSADIFYIDYGSTEVATLENICVEFPPIVRSVPPMAVRCCLAGIKPIAKSWTSRGVKTFTNLTAACTLQTLVIYADPGYLLVSLYGREGSNPRSIAHQLLDEELALPIEDNEVPEFVSEIPAFLALLQPPPEPSAVSSDDRPSKDINKLEVKESVSSPTKTSEKYVPPGRKQSGSSPGSATRNGPVHDFFPFENVSTYPPTPTDSPTKPSSLGKGSSPGSSEGSYFSRSPGRGDIYYHDYDRSDQAYGSPGKIQNGYGRDFNSNYSDRSPQKAFHASESPRSLSSFETPPGQTGLVSANSRNGEEGSGARNHGNSPAVNRLQNGNVQTFIPPFYQPKQPYTDVTQMNFSKSPKQTSLTPPTAYEHHTGFESQNVHPPLTPPGFYESHKSSNNDFNHRHKYESYSSNSYEQQYPGNFNNSNLTNSSGKSYPGSYPGSYNARSDYRDSNARNDYRDSNARSDYRDNDRDRYREGPVKMDTSPSGSSYAEEKTKGNPSVRLQMPNATPLSTPSKSPGSYYSSKQSPISPESPAIANFDMNDIEHTMNVSTHGLHQKSYEQKLMALQEEADDIARESQEQMQLVKMARLGRGDSENLAEDYRETGAPDIFDRISEEIRDASNHESLQFYEDMRRSPVKRRMTNESRARLVESDRPPKLEEMPQNYLVDIDFSVAVKEALESSKTEGMDNTRALLEEIVESLKTARVEKQLYDVIVLLLATSIHEYNLYHLVVMDTISKLNDEFDVKDTLAKALKKQQDIHVRVPVPKKETHLDFSRMMGHVYNMSLDWRDSNSSIQDSILNTIERWIVFNNKGTQIGQTDKENVFLDCFTLFWEVSGEELRKHNHIFYVRLQDEVKKKLLNDNVTRSIKERLLGILLEMFSSVEVKPSTDMFTQTPKRTMIPSSCQVKPTCCDKGTMTEDEDQVYHDIIFSPENRLYNNAEMVTPEISLRPAKSWAQEYHSTPHEDYRISSGDKHFDGIPVAPSTSLYSENSYTESSYSVYETPNESLADDMKALTVSDKISSVDCTASTSQSREKSSKDKKVSDLKKSEKQAVDHKLENVGKSKLWASVASRNNAKEVREVSAKANIVDWFEYNPEPQSTTTETVINKKVTSKKSNISKSNKSGHSLTDIAKEFVSQPVKQDITPVKQESDICKEKAASQNTDKVQMTDIGHEGKDAKHRHDSPKHHESVAEKLAKNSELDQKHEKTNTEKASVKEEPPAEESLVNVVNNENVDEENIDWWGDQDRSKTTENVIHDEILLPPEEKIIVKDKDEFGFESDFDDDDDQQWETHSESDNEKDIGAVSKIVASQKPSNYDCDFPPSDFAEVIKLPADFGASSKVVNNDYDNDFPETDLASYIDPPQPTVQETGARWVPGVRCCTLCGDKGHTSSNCPDSASKLFL